MLFLFKKPFEKFKTALRIGIIFSLRVIVYKFLLKFRLHPVLRIKKNKETHYTEQSDLYISINNIKMKNSFITVQLFTI